MPIWKRPTGPNYTLFTFVWALWLRWKLIFGNTPFTDAFTIVQTSFRWIGEKWQWNSERSQADGKVGEQKNEAYK